MTTAIWILYSEEILLLPYTITFFIVDYLADFYSATISISGNISLPSKIAVQQRYLVSTAPMAR